MRITVTIARVGLRVRVGLGSISTGWRVRMGRACGWDNDNLGLGA